VGDPELQTYNRPSFLHMNEVITHRNISAVQSYEHHHFICTNYLSLPLPSHSVLIKPIYPQETPLSNKERSASIVNINATPEKI
jgi:hypothetical protein